MKTEGPMSTSLYPTSSYSVLSHFNPAHSFKLYFFNIHNSITFPSTPIFLKWSSFHTFRLSFCKPVSTSSRGLYLQAFSSILILSSEKYILNLPNYDSHHCPVLSCFLPLRSKYIFSVIFSDTFSTCIFLL
jgi:hypothetical protein